MTTDGASSRRARPAQRAAFFGIALSVFSARAGAENAPFSDSDVLEAPPYVAVELVQTRITAFDQTGHGYQSQEGPRAGPGSETLRVLQGQAEFVMRQGERLRHRLWVPVDVVTSASANAIDRYYAKPDVVSTASAQNVSSEADYQLAVRADRDTTWTGGVGFHHEENFLSYTLSLDYQRALADDNATLALGLNQVLDWFDVFALGGDRDGRTSRSSTNFNVQLSQLLSPSTLVGASYGLTLQRGELSNTWNTVPTSAGERVREALPEARTRHALSLELVQFLPWQALAKLRYRFYADDWDVTAHSIEAELEQRLARWLAFGVSYRHHQQTAVAFFTTRAAPNDTFVTADSDLGAFSAQTLGADATVTLPTQRFGALFLSLGYDRYFRSDDLEVSVATWASGLRF